MTIKVDAPVVKHTPISQEVMDLADRVSQSLTMEKTTGIAAVPDDTYVKLMPVDLNEDVAKRLQTYNMEFAAASLYALGEAAIPVFTKQKELEKVSLVVPMIGKDKLELEMERSRQVPFREEDGTNTTRSSFGTTSVKMDIYGVGKRGDLKKIKELLSEQATAAFGK